MGIYDIAYDLNNGKIRTDFYGRNPAYKAKRELLGKESSYDTFEMSRIKSIINDTDKYVIAHGRDEIEPFRYVFDEVFDQLGLRDNILIICEQLKLYDHSNPIRHKVMAFESEETDIFSLAFKKDSFDRNEVFYWDDMARTLGAYSFHVLYPPETRNKLLHQIQDKIKERIDTIIKSGEQQAKHSILKLHRRELTSGIKVPNYSTITSSLYGVPYLSLKNAGKSGYRAITFSSNFKLAAAYSDTEYKEFIRKYKELDYNYESPIDREKIKDTLFISEGNHFRFGTDVHKEISLAYKKFIVMLRFEAHADILLLQSDFAGITILLNDATNINEFIEKAIEIMRLSDAINYIDSITLHNKSIRISDIYDIKSDNHILLGI